MTGRPRKGTPVRFDRADGIAPEQESDTVVGLRFTIEARYGGTVDVDLAGIHQRALAIAFAGALRRQSEPGGALGARSTIKQHLNAYRRFFSYLREHSATTTPADLRIHDVDGFETFLEANGMTPIHRHTVLAKVVLALRAIDADRPDLLDEAVRRRLSYTSARSAGRSRPRDAYSLFVARQLRDAARSDIVRIFRRLGTPFDDGHADPTLCRLNREMNAILASEGRFGSLDPRYQRLGAARRLRGLPVSTLSEDLHSRFHLRALDIPPLLTFLSLETGLEIECCKALTIDCLRNPGAGTVEISYIKRRARGAEHKHIRVRDGGVGTPGGLIRKLVEATAFTRRFIPGTSLWLYYHTGPGQLRSGIDHPKENVNRWVRSHGIVDDDGKPLRLALSRLRKTNKALWYLKTEGHMARFAVGHTPEIAARHYADIPSLRALHEATVAEALSEVVEAAGSVILAPDDEEAWRKSDAGAADLMTGEQDVWLAACTGFDASPFGEPGSPCPQPFWGCLECRNAVITVRKLPMIIAFLRFIEDQRAGLPATYWALKFRRAHDRITRQILPAFSESVVADARCKSDALTLYLPPEARQ